MINSTIKVNHNEVINKYWILVILLLSSGFCFGQTLVFTDVTTSKNIDTVLAHSPLSGNGISLADYNNDGHIDLYLCTEFDIPDRLYQNLGNGEFIEIASNIGLGRMERSRAGLWFDYDNDRDLDLVVVGDCYERNDCEGFLNISLYQQLENGTFHDVTTQSGLDFDFQTNPEVQVAVGGISAADINGDTFLDLIVTGWYSQNVVWFGSAGGTFVKAPENASGFTSDFSANWQPMPLDFNKDGHLDIYANVDFASNELWMNTNSGANFVNRASEAGIDNAFNEMGMAFGDYDNDGDLDFYVTNITENSPDKTLTHNLFYENNSTNNLMKYSENAAVLGVDQSGWDWGTTFFDANNDGWLDLATTNGWIIKDGKSPKDPMKLWQNNEGYFTDVSTVSGLDAERQATTLLAFDMDRDGDLDVIQSLKESAPLQLFENTGEYSNNYLVIKPRMNENNHFAIGAVVRIKSGEMNQMRLITAGTSFYGQEPAEAFFGVENSTTIDEVRVEWPDGTLTKLNNVDANQVLTVTNDEIVEEILGCMDINSCNYNSLATVDDGSCSYISDHEIIGPTDSGFNRTETYTFNITENNQVSWMVENGELLDGQGTNTITVKWKLEDHGTITLVENSDTCSRQVSIRVNLDVNNTTEAVSVARIWNEALLEAIRRDYARPTVHARNLFHTSVALYDAWAIHEGTNPYLLGNEVHGYKSSFSEFNPSEDREASKEKAMSYAAYRLLTHRFAISPGAEQSLERFNLIMGQLGYDTGNSSLNYQSGDAAALGNFIANTIIFYGNEDHSREATDYDNAFYQPVNPPLDLNGGQNNGTGIVDPGRWQPLSFNTFIDQSGNLIPGSTPEFLSPEWGAVHPFSLSESAKQSFNRNGAEYTVYHNPEAPPHLNDSNSALKEQYQWNFALVSVWSSQLDPKDGVMWDISPKSIGNIDIDLYPDSYVDYSEFYNEIDGGDISIGHSLNPITGQAYETQLVPRGDYTRVLAEFWADGPDSETPPGHWFTILNYVTDHALFERRFNGEGEPLSALEWDVKAYFILGGAMHDAAVTAWGIKGWHDYIRPISAIRYMCELGQSTDPNLSNYNPEGIPLKDGYIEVVEFGDALSGASNEHVGKIKLKAWRGHDFISNASTDVAGVGWILAENWWPYQRPSFVTPPFAGFVSGHSTFSRAAAEVMTLITGDAFFPGGMGEFVAKKNEFLVFEKGPSIDVVLQWATYRDASDQTSLSRIWGGIHPPADDIPGRIIGEKIGIDAYHFALPYFEQRMEVATDSEFIVYPNPVEDMFYIYGLEPGTPELNIYSMDGKHVKQVKTNELNGVNIGNLSSGTYILSIKINKKTLSKILIKK